MGVVEADSDTNDGDKELTDQHAQGTVDEDRPTSESLNCVERDGSGAYVDEGEDQGNKEYIADGAGRLQKDSGVVEDEVNPSPAKKNQ